MTICGPKGVNTLMLKLRLHLAILAASGHLFSSSTCTYAAEASRAKQVFRSASQSVVKVQTRTLQGSGVILESTGNDSYVVTNAHVVKGGIDSTVLVGGRSYPARTVAEDEQLDLAVIKISGERLKGVRAVRGSEPQVAVGDPVFAIGSPIGLSNTLSEGIVSGLRLRNGTSLIQTSAAISKGSSGGGLFDAQGRLVGITTFKLANGENLNFAVNTKHLAELFNSTQHDATSTSDSDKEFARSKLTELHPDWPSVVASPEFRAWKANLPKAEKDRLDGSWDWRYIASKISEFKRGSSSNEATLLLVCDALDPSSKQRHELQMNVSHARKTINGKPATITDTQLRVDEENPKFPGESFTTMISRVSGFMTYTSTKYGVLLEGTCKVAADRRF